MKQKLFKYIFSIFLLISLCSSFSFSQPVIEWVQRYNSSGSNSDYVTVMTLDKTGNVYLAGYIKNNDTMNSFLTLKYNSNGNFQWARTYNCMGGWDGASGIVVDSFGNVYVTGRSDTINPSHSNMPYFAIIKYSDNGDLLWIRKYINPDSIYALPNAICIDDSSNIYVTGDSYSNTQNSNYTTVKYNKDGQFIWSRFYDVANNYDVPWSIVCKNNFIYITGGTSGSYANTLKYNLNGDLLLTANFIGQGKKIAVDDSNSIYVGGEKLVNGYYVFKTNKYDSSGVLQWTKIFQDTNWYNSANYLRDMCIDRNGNTFVTGYSPRDAPSGGYSYVTIKYNSFGDSLWTRIYKSAYHSNDQVESITTDKFGNVYVTGSSDNNLIWTHYATVKYNSQGVRQWVANYNNNNEFSNHYGNIVRVDTTGNIYVTGNSEGSGTGMDIATIKYSVSTGIRNITSEIPGENKLFQNYPNPFNASTKIEFTIKENGAVQLVVFDILGRKVNSLVDGYKTAGKYETVFDASNLSSGIYFYRLSFKEEIIDNKKLFLIK
ncbi:MAG TPA: SBBP repeat-containing protein [Ignavibacteria bacterium]